MSLSLWKQTQQHLKEGQFGEAEVFQSALVQWSVCGGTPRDEVGLMYEYIIDAYMFNHDNKMKWWEWIEQALSIPSTTSLIHNKKSQIVKEAIKGFRHHKNTDPSYYAKLFNIAFIDSKKIFYDEMIPFFNTLLRNNAPAQAWEAIDALALAQDWEHQERYLRARFGVLVDGWVAEYQSQSLESLDVLLTHHGHKKAVLNEGLEKILTSDTQNTAVWDLLIKHGLTFDQYVHHRLLRALYVSDKNPASQQSRGVWVEYLVHHVDLSETVQKNLAKTCLDKHNQRGYLALVSKNPSLLCIQANQACSPQETYALKDEAFGRLGESQQQQWGPDLVSVHPELLEYPCVQKWHLTQALSSTLQGHSSVPLGRKL